MKVSDFNFDLPDELIAQYPPQNRTDSRLLKVLNGKGLVDDVFPSIACELNEGDLVILNNTRVLPARLFGKKESGGKIEILLERITAEDEFVAQIRSSRAPREGQKLFVDGDSGAQLTVVGRQGTFFVVKVKIKQRLFSWLESVGHMPLPPYIDRADQLNDKERYQTVFAKKPGAVAAPTAGLHYDEVLINKLKAKGVRFAYVTLHVGAGTYQPVRVDSIDQHVMHSEYIEVDEDVCKSIVETKQSGGQVIAVGTTVIRSLESAAEKAKRGLIEPYSGETDIFIYPGFEFKVVDKLQTNFHLPESTLLMLVSAFCGYERVMSAYQYAIEQKYRFFSYGDAMLLDRQSD
ncbi:MAG: tRNA preQ1(34) S-adenosylmethionine ribosyltransferase-isomerase QueA [Gammaproteobacteria bacterium]|nr:tRNA preQ1(34) S-adenosylmethionine ribosyltransferase-isomerase QueA [Gammaproteobacteria bacterium]